MAEQKNDSAVAEGKNVHLVSQGKNDLDMGERDEEAVNPLDPKHTHE